MPPRRLPAAGVLPHCAGAEGRCCATHLPTSASTARAVHGLLHLVRMQSPPSSCRRYRVHLRAGYRRHHGAAPATVGVALAAGRRVILEAAAGPRRPGTAAGHQRQRRPGGWPAAAPGAGRAAGLRAAGAAGRGAAPAACATTAPCWPRWAVGLAAGRGRSCGLHRQDKMCICEQPQRCNEPCTLRPRCKLLEPLKDCFSRGTG